MSNRRSFIKQLSLSAGGIFLSEQLSALSIDDQLDVLIKKNHVISCCAVVGKLKILVTLHTHLP